MAKRIYSGINNLAENSDKIYYGVNNIARKVVRAYYGDESNIARMVFDNLPKIYGVSWNKSSSTSMTRTDLAADFNDPSIATGTGSGSSPFDTVYPWSNIRKVTDGNNVLVEIPKFWYKITNSTSAFTIQISDKETKGFYVSPMHADRGDGVGERDVAYIGRYKCASSTYYSKSGQTVQRSMTRATARSKIAALGTGYYQFDYAAFWTLRLLYLVEFADWDASSMIEKTGTASFTLATYTSGLTDSMTYHTGVNSDGTNAQYRYVEDPWYNILEWVDGIYFTSANAVYCINNPSKFSDSSNGTKIGTRPTSDGYIKDWTVPNVSGYEYALWPSSISSSVGYIAVYYYPESGTVLYTGGYIKHYSQHGPFFLYTDFTASSTSSSIGTRLMKLPS